jgi:hypothetical protein
MVKKTKLNLKRVGHYSFLFGIILAVLVALIPQLTATEQVSATVTWTLIVLGLLVGLLNINVKETTGFLTASLVLLISVSMASWNIYIPGVSTALWKNIVVFITPAAIIVAIKTIYALAQD